MRSKGWIRSPWLTIRVQLALGAIFLFAGFSKIADPPGFAQEISNYRLVPAPAVHVLALVLPWVEVVSGLALVLGFWRQTAAAILGILLLVFVAGLSINLARGRPIECGCFGASAAAKTPAELLTEMKWGIARDLGMLAMAGQLLAAASERRRWTGPALRPRP